MQTDRKLIKTQSRTRATPVPPRTSAHPEAVVRVQPGYARAYQASMGDDISRLPTTSPPVMWQYETAEYVAESSLASLSLLTARRISRSPASEVLDTRPLEASVPLRRKTSSADTAVRDLADIDTVPPPSAQLRTQREVELADIPTMPTGVRGSRQPDRIAAGRERLPFHTNEEPVRSSRASVERDRRAIPPFNPFDRLRWWLLYPGRLESLLWSGGIVLLVCITIFLSVMTALSVAVSHPEQADTMYSNALQRATAPALCGKALTTNGDGGKCIVATAASPEGLQISLFSSEAFMVDSTVHLQGLGFSPSGRVTIMHDANQPCQPGSVQADRYGNIDLLLALQHSAGWSPGNHTLLLVDVTSGRRVMLAFVLCTNKN